MWWQEGCPIVRAQIPEEAWRSDSGPVSGVPQWCGISGPSQLLGTAFPSSRILGRGLCSPWEHCHGQNPDSWVAAEGPSPHL